MCTILNTSKFIVHVSVAKKNNTPPHYIKKPNFPPPPHIQKRYMFGYSKPKHKQKYSMYYVNNNNTDKDDAKTILDIIISNNDVVLFGFKNCPKTIEAKFILYEKYIEFVEIDLNSENNLILIQELSYITGISSIPFIFFYGEFIDITSLPYM
jgi:glutaredoxin